MMPMDWFNGREAISMGSALADQLAQRALSATQTDKTLQDLLRGWGPELSSLRLNFYKRAKLANSFKWRLLEKGVETQLVEVATQGLLMHLMNNAGRAPDAVGATAGQAEESIEGDKSSARSGNFKRLLMQGNASFAAGDYEQALGAYQQMVQLKPRNAEAQNNLGAALYKLERFGDAEERFRQAVKLKSDYPEALFNLGAVLHWQGYLVETVSLMRRALKLRPNYADARSLLGRTLAMQGRTRDARQHLEKALAAAPNDMEALLAMGQLATMEGRFDDAERWYQRSLEQEANPRTPTALAGLAVLRRMTAADAPWLDRARQMADGDLLLTEEAALRYAIGKYYDDVGDYPNAFRSYQRANEISKQFAAEFNHAERVKFVDDMIRSYSRDNVAAVQGGGSDSERPVFVVGMPRSGTTLTEQIIAAHPAAAGAGELDFWNFAGRRHMAEVQSGRLPEATAKKLAADYLRVLAEHSADARRVVDKAPINCDYVGLIHSVFPRAHFIWMQRNPIDTCLSCYFQPFTQALNFTMNLSDLEHYYRQYHRLMAHWCAVLPPGTLLEVPYEQLVADQAAWTRKMLEFIGLDWDERCLNFQSSQQGVATASSWQVRQKIYRTSVERWRKYEKFIGPLKALKDLAA
jgi:tetratricopeptide (TPR) repeat protein